MNTTTEDLVAQLDVSRETLIRLRTYVALVEKWQPRVNLISPTTLPDIWHRHIWDSAQLVPLLAGKTPSIMDVGSGAGFPGLVLAIMTDCPVTLVESDQKKSIFLQTVIRECGLQATVLTQRVEALDRQDVDLITARALAPVDRLLPLLDRQLAPSDQNGPMRCLFLKGQSVHEELTCLDDRPHISWQLHPSLTNPHAFVLDLTVQTE